MNEGLSPIPDIPGWLKGVAVLLLVSAKTSWDHERQHMVTP